MTSPKAKELAMDEMIKFLRNNGIEIGASEYQDLKAKGTFFRKVVELGNYNTGNLKEISADFGILVKKGDAQHLILGTVATNYPKKLLTPISDGSGFTKPVAKGRYGAEMIGADLHVVICLSAIHPTIHSVHEKKLIQSILHFGKGKETIVLEWDDVNGIKQGLHSPDKVLSAISAAENRP
jgi:hypothetical protein